MHTTNLRKVGGSVMLAVPRPILDLLRLEPGAAVGLSVEQGRLIVQPAPKPRYTIDELLAQCEPDAAISQEDRDWLDTPPVGQEL
jgi:antitoxin ChpS